MPRTHTPQPATRRRIRRTAGWVVLAIGTGVPAASLLSWKALRLVQVAAPSVLLTLAATLPLPAGLA